MKIRKWETLFHCRNALLCSAILLSTNLWFRILSVYFKFCFLTLSEDSYSILLKAHLHMTLWHRTIEFILTLYHKTVEERNPEEIILLFMIFHLLLHQHTIPKYKKRKKKTYNCKIRGLLYVSPTSSFLLFNSHICVTCKTKSIWIQNLPSTKLKCTQIKSVMVTQAPSGYCGNTHNKTTSLV